MDNVNSTLNLIEDALECALTGDSLESRCQEDQTIRTEEFAEDAVPVHA